jgi:hypothetical protein
MGTEQNRVGEQAARLARTVSRRDWYITIAIIVSVFVLQRANLQAESRRQTGVPHTSQASPLAEKVADLERRLSILEARLKLYDTTEADHHPSGVQRLNCEDRKYLEIGVHGSGLSLLVSCESIEPWGIPGDAADR